MPLKLSDSMNDIQSTMSYQRYALSKEDIQKLLEEIENSKGNNL